MGAGNMNLSEISSLTEDQARDYFEKIRWPNGVVCPHCGSVESTKLKGKAHRQGLYDCRGCHAQFTATVNTIMEDSHLPIRTWLMAFSILCSAKKGISALQLQRCGVRIHSMFHARILSNIFREIPVFCDKCGG